MKPVHILAVAGFGQAVARRLADMLSSVVITDATGGEAVPAAWPVASVHVLAAWRPMPQLAAVLDACTYRWKVPWLPIISEHPNLRIGPTVAPGYGPCYTCFSRRYLQHSSTPDLTEALHLHYANHPTVGPLGFSPAMVTMAAMTAYEVLQSLSSDPAVEAGVIRQINLQTLKTIKTGTVGVHGCPNCGRGRDERNRSYDLLAADLRRLYPEGIDAVWEEGR